MEGEPRSLRAPGQGSEQSSSPEDCVVAVGGALTALPVPELRRQPPPRLSPQHHLKCWRCCFPAAGQ